MAILMWRRWKKEKALYVRHDKGFYTCELLGYKAQDLSGRDLSHVIPNSSRIILELPVVCVNIPMPFKDGKPVEHGIHIAVRRNVCKCVFGRYCSDIVYGRVKDTRNHPIQIRGRINVKLIEKALVVFGLSQMLFFTRHLCFCKS